MCNLASTYKHVWISFYPYSTFELNLSKVYSVPSSSCLNLPSTFSARKACIPISWSARPTFMTLGFCPGSFLYHDALVSQASSYASFKAPLKWLLFFEIFCWPSMGSVLHISIHSSICHVESESSIFFTQYPPLSLLYYRHLIHTTQSISITHLFLPDDQSPSFPGASLSAFWHLPSTSSI